MQRDRIGFFMLLTVAAAIAGCSASDDDDGARTVKLREKSSGHESENGTASGDSAPSSDEQQQTASPDAEASGLGTLAGRVRFEGKVPPPRTIQVTKDVEHCTGAAGEVPEVVVSSDGFLKHAVIEIRGIRSDGEWEWQQPDDGYVIRQTGCRFHPNVLIARDGATLTIYNDDPLQHNINTGQWNVVQGPSPLPIERTIRYAGRSFLRVSCNIHNWMETWVYVARSPYHSATGPDGRFQIDGIPPDTHRVVVSHPTLGSQRLRVEIPAGETVEEEIVFRSPLEAD